MFASNNTSMLELLCFINKYFLEDPLKTAEIETICNSAFSRIERKPNSRDQVISSVLFQQLLAKYKDVLFCPTKPTQWFFWEDRVWSEVPEVRIQRFIMDEIQAITPDALKSFIINEVMYLLEKQLAEEHGKLSSDKTFSIIGLRNFKKGTQVFTDQKILPHKTIIQIIVSSLTNLSVDYDFDKAPA